jgi:protein O-mannosyl-transferase
LFVAIAWFVADGAARFRVNQRILTAAFVIALFPYVYVTRTQLGYWHDSYTLFTHTLQVTQNNGIAENNLGSALLEMGQPQQATPHFETAARLIPELARAHYNLAVALQVQNRPQEASQQYHLAIAVSSDPLEAAHAHNNLGILLLNSKDFSGAMKELSAAIALNPNEQNSYLGRGMIELQSWNYDAAVADFSRATEIAPSPVGCFWLGRAFESKGDYHRAENAYTAALRLAPGMADARARLDALHAKAAE